MNNSLCLSHVLYKVSNLNKSVNEFIKKGFHVEFGSKNRPHNALIYFSDGPYIELIKAPPVSKFSKMLLKLIGKQKLVDRFNNWENSKPGYFEICLETYSNNFKNEIKILNRCDQKYFITSSKRLDPKNRLLKWKLLFPMEVNLPFFMTYFNIDPKPKNFIHPNGISKIKKVVYSLDKKFMSLLEDLCEDELLFFKEGSGELQVIFDK
jgi:hypothetical protein